MRALDEHESAVLLEAAKGVLIYPLVMVAITTGLRRGELAGLKWGDVDFQAATLSVNRAIEETRRYGVVEKLPKTGRSRRLIALPNIKIKMLKGIKKEQAELKLKLGKIYNDQRYIFASDDASVWKPTYITRSFRRLVQKSDLGHLRLHDLRHTHASQLLKQGVNPKIVSERLGHSSIAMTMDTYSHVLPGL